MNDELTDSKRKFIWHFLDLVFRWRRLLVFNALAAAIVALLIAFLFPNWYKASTSIMPPEKDMGVLGTMSGFLSSGMGALLGSGGLALPAFASPSDLYAEILKSKIVSLAVINKNNLKEVFEVSLDEKAIKELEQRRKVQVQPVGIITLTYEDTDPDRAALVANSFIEELNKVNREILVSKAKATREFIEQRLEETIADLTLAEDAYKNFQERHGAISIEAQVKAKIDAVAKLHGELAMAEIELGVMKKTLSPDNIRYKNQLYKIQQIKEQLESLEKGNSNQTSFLNLPISETPELGLELARLARELKIQETVFELLKQQYEHAKIQEMRDTPTIQVLDVAQVPKIKSRPRRSMIGAMAAMLSFGFSLLGVMFLEFVRKEKEENSLIYQKLSSFSRMLKEDFFWIRNFFRLKRTKNGN